MALLRWYVVMRKGTPVVRRKSAALKRSEKEERVEATCPSGFQAQERKHVSAQSPLFILLLAPPTRDSVKDRDWDWGIGLTDDLQLLQAFIDLTPELGPLGELVLAAGLVQLLLVGEDLLAQGGAPRVQRPPEERDVRAVRLPRCVPGEFGVKRNRER